MAAKSELDLKPTSRQLHKHLFFRMCRIVFNFDFLYAAMREPQDLLFYADPEAPATQAAVETLMKVYDYSVGVYNPRI